MFTMIYVGTVSTPFPIHDHA